MSELNKLAALILNERASIMAEWRKQVREIPSARDLSVAALNDHIPGLLHDLACALREKSDQSIPEALAETSPIIHGLQRLNDHFDVEEVVSEYNVMRGCIHNIADAQGLNLQGRPLHIINRVFDHAIGLALKTYTNARALEIQQRREEYLAFVAHDLRTPLTAIGMAEKILHLTLAEELNDERLAKVLGVLRRSVNQLDHLVAKVLEENAHLQTDSGMKLVCREFDLWSLVESLIFDLSTVAHDAGTQLVNQVPDGLIVYADASLMRRLFQNLISNAIRYTPNGEITIGAKENSESRDVECWVRDNGAGISESMLDKIFTKGESDPENASGLGLGLAIVKTIAEAHGGQITVESKKESGSTFRITLPCKRSERSCIKTRIRRGFHLQDAKVR